MKNECKYQIRSFDNVEALGGGCISEIDCYSKKEAKDRAKVILAEHGGVVQLYSRNDELLDEWHAA